MPCRAAGRKAIELDLMTSQQHNDLPEEEDVTAADRLIVESPSLTGLIVLRALSPFDIGQAVIVIDGHVVGVEDIEGTDGLLARVARLRAEGRIRAKTARGVLVKAPKNGQDLRFDLPTIGARTVEGAAAASLAGIAIVAGNTLVAEPQTMIETADAAGLFVIGLPA